MQFIIEDLNLKSYVALAVVLLLCFVVTVFVVVVVDDAAAAAVEEFGWPRESNTQPTELSTGGCSL